MYRIQNKKNVPEGTQFGYETDKHNSFNQQIVNYIYSTIDLFRFKYEILKFDSDLTELLKQKYLVSANFSGSSSLLVFTKINDKFNSCLIDRSTLKYNQNKINFNAVEISNVNLSLEPSIYNGTILDGINYKNKNENIFIISDIYYFKGQDFTNTKLDIKLHTILTYLKTNYDENNKNNNIILTVNKTYSITETDHLINNVIPNMKSISVKGICFYPEISGSKLIYSFNNDKCANTNMISNIKTNQILPVKNNTQFNQEINQKSNINLNAKKYKKTIYLPLKMKDINYVFEMKKTDIPDVYHLNAVELVESEENNLEIKNKILRRKRISLAYIPNIEKSNWCKNAFKNINFEGNYCACDKILVNCKFHIDKQRWEPISISNASRPSFISDFQPLNIDE
jgi:hypothetical protein